MKTDFIEIFQTIRAALQPYATLGFSNRINSDKHYDLWSDKNVMDGKEKKSETFFVSIHAEAGHALLKTNFKHQLLGGKQEIEIKELDPELMNEIEGAFATGYKIFKEKEWV